MPYCKAIVHVHCVLYMYGPLPEPPLACSLIGATLSMRLDYGISESAYYSNTKVQFTYTVLLRLCSLEVSCSNHTEKMGPVFPLLSY